MTPEQWKRLDEIYHSARLREPADRAAYLVEACSGDETLRREIESLLAHGEVLSNREAGLGLQAEPSELMVEAMVGPYRIEQRLDAGGMGTVYRAVDTRLGRHVAIKVGSAQFSDRFYREARAVAALNHPNVCTLHDIGSAPGIPGYLVMEFVDGPTLASRMESGPMPIAEALQVARQIAGALAAAHERGIVHRDLKPANIKLTAQGIIKVLDFGLAKNFPGAMAQAPGTTETTRVTQPITQELTAEGTILGTVAYMSPEQAAGKEIDARSDVFSFGIVLYEMLCGRRPFTGPTTPEVITAILRTEPTSPRQSRPDIPEDAERILIKCLHKVPEERYSSGKALEQDLDALIESTKTSRFLSLRSTLAAAALLIAVIGGYYGWQAHRRQADLRWLNDTAVPEIERLSKEDRLLDAAHIYRQAERIAPGSKLLYKFTDGLKPQSIKFETTPPGADIYISDYTAAASDNFSDWQKIGVSPMMADLPIWGYYRIRALKDGYDPTDQVFGAIETTVQVLLHEKGSVPPGMVWVPGVAATEILPSISLPGFWLDRYEVTNREYQHFVEMGGYSKSEYWKAPFVKDGRPLSWEQATLEFHDLTARPGPANWILGAYPEGAADLPVAGVSWYEAMAYCEFAGKSLPTVYEFRVAAPPEFNADVALMSNFSGKAVAPVGAYHGMNLFGSYDMAGNLAEWTANSEVGRTMRYVSGGSWEEASYQYGINNARDPFVRTISMGFRCVKRPTPPPAESLNPLQLLPAVIHKSTDKPVNDQTYRILAAFHQYTPTALDSKITHVDDSSPYWTRQTVSFQAAYGNDRVIAHLFLPKNAVPPYQVIVVFGGADIMSTKRIEDYRFPYEFLIRSGRAVMIPAYFGTLERGPSNWHVPPQDERDRSLKYSWDLSRSVDYLQTRPDDIDVTKLGYYGISWGAIPAPRLLAIDQRFKAAALVSGGLWPFPVEVDPWNFASRYHVPTLMLNGKQDSFFPYETNTKVFFDALGTPIADKKLLLFDGGHRNPIARPDLLGEIIMWFDHYLGPVKER